MKFILFVFTVILFLTMKTFAIGSNDRTIHTENITSKKSDQDIIITPTGTGVLDIDTTTGVLMPRGTTAQRPTGTNGVLRYNSTINDFEGFKNGVWDTLGGGGGGSLATVEKTANATLATTGEDIVLCDTTSGDVTLTLPTASGNNGLVYRIHKKVNANDCIIDGNSTEEIDGETTQTLQSIGETIQIASNGTNWYSIHRGGYERCETKTLSADVTTTGVVSDLTFNNLVIGKKYKIFGSLKIQGTDDSNDNPKTIVALLGDGTQRFSNMLYSTVTTFSGMSFNIYSQFIAGDTSVELNVNTLTRMEIKTNVQTLEKSLTLCEIPSITNTTTTEF